MYSDWNSNVRKNVRKFKDEVRGPDRPSGQRQVNNVRLCEAKGICTEDPSSTLFTVGLPDSISTEVKQEH